MAVVKHVQSKIPVSSIAKEEKPIRKIVTNTESEEKGPSKSTEGSSRAKKRCYFCVHKTEPSYQDVASLKRYVSDRGRIYSRSRNGNCAKHQRMLGKQIKYARHLAMIPFLVRA